MGLLNLVPLGLELAIIILAADIQCKSRQVHEHGKCPICYIQCMNNMGMNALSLV